MKIAMFMGAGFSKAWGLSLASEIMDMRHIRTNLFPGKWQRKLIDKVKAVWDATKPTHKGVVDEFARMLQQFEYELSFEEFTSFLALRLSSKHWKVGTARETKWGTGDHIRKQRVVPKCYQEFFKVLKNVDLIGIITTNYDLVIEKLLGPTSRGRLGGFNYGKVGEHLLGRHPLSSRWTYGPITVTGKIPLLKLNGSLNWALSSDGQILKYIDSRPSRGRRYEVLLIPPGAGIKHDKLQPVWEHAGQILRAADIWIFCGYSIPDYDQAVKDLLKNSIENVKRIIILDVKPKPVKDKLRDLLSNSRDSVSIYVGPGITSQLNARDIAHLMKPS